MPTDDERKDSASCALPDPCDECSDFFCPWHPSNDEED